MRNEADEDSAKDEVKRRKEDAATKGQDDPRLGRPPDEDELRLLPRA